MNEKIVNIAFEILSSYPDVIWERLYLSLFESATREGNKKIAVKSFYKMIFEAVKTENTWAIEKLITEKDYLAAIDDLGLYLIAERAFVTIPNEPPRGIPQKYLDQDFNFRDDFKFQFRDGNQHSLCACCCDFVLTCEEIQHFPLVNDENYIREKFALALNQDKIHKRIFIIDYLITRYAQKNPDWSLLFELWIMAEKSGIHIGLYDLDKQLADRAFEQKYFKDFLTIINFRHHEHDHMVDGAVELFLKRKRYDLAFYLNGKISTPSTRLRSAMDTVLNFNNEDFDENNMGIFLRKVSLSVKHEEVQND
ncbi:MAG: hypothetical protein PHY93_20855 [Bacteriovorax sp.]|nr:hypothetical protein [Bacteriovorax sp.]